MERFGIKVHGYALMPNHFHLMVESVHGNLSSAMQHLLSRYCRWVNLTAGFDGSLFRGRFHNRLVFENSHWRHLLIYLHLNPVRANLVMRPEQAHWTSHGKYLGEDRYPEWLTTSDLRRRFKGVSNYRRYLRDVMIGRTVEPSGFDVVTFEDRRAGRLMMVKKERLPDVRSIDEALEQVMRVTHATESDLHMTQRGRTGNPVRALAAWWLVYGAGLSNTETGAQLGMSPSAVGKLLSKVRTNRSYQDGQLRDWVVALEESAGKGQ